MKTLIRFFVLVFVLLVFVIHAVTAEAADRYVRKGATGSGTSWADAWGDLNNVSWTGMSGSTLWIAAGSYTRGLPTANVANVTIRRATTAAHGTDTGWSTAYDGQVTVSPSSGTNFLVISSSADGLILDGVSFHPWKFRVVGVRGYNGMLRNDGADNVVIRGIEFDGMGESTGNGGPEDGLRWMGGANSVIEHSFIHDYRYFDGGSHNDGVQGPSCTNITFRYNVFKNNGMHIFLGDYAWGNQYCNGITIHHNVFYNDANGGSYNCIDFKGTNQNGSYTNKIENNVFNLRGQGIVLYLSNSGCSTCNNTANSYFRNNIVYSSSVGNVASYSHSYNLYYNSSGPTETGRVTANPLFTDVNANDYSLQADSPAIGAGANLGYTEDILGKAIGSAPDMGPYEFGGGIITTPPLPPSNVRVIR
jgi:hypothetical protein